MRVCPKCGFQDPPEWKHLPYSYWIDSCSLENFEMLYPDLAKNLTKKGSTTEDELYVYRLCKNGIWVERRAKIDFVNKGDNMWRDKTEKYRPPQSPWCVENPEKRPKLWNWNKNQRRLLEGDKKE